MSKSVRIPDYTTPSWSCSINGVKYSYPSGTVQEVPDAVAYFIESLRGASQKKEAIIPPFGGTFDPKIVCTATGCPISLKDSSSHGLIGLKLYGKTTQNGEPSPDAPAALESVGDSGSVDVIVCGKNILNMQRKTETKSGVTWIAEGTVLTIRGTAAGLYGDIMCKNVRIEAGTYTVSFKNLEKLNRIELDCAYEDGTKVFAMQYVTASKPSFTFTAKEHCYVSMTFVIASGTALGNENNPTFIYAQIEAGSKITEYAPYKGQNLTISTPNGLSGIPVDSGGNYTETSGQQWICDEVDLEKGVYVQRIGKIDSYNGEVLPGAYISSMGELSTGATVLYQLRNDQQSCLNPGELANYTAMHTSYPNTMVYNDAGAFMEVQYVADTKLYIDEKFA